MLRDGVMRLFKIYLASFCCFLLINTVLPMDLSQDELDDPAEIELQQPNDVSGRNKLTRLWRSVKEKGLFLSEFWRNRHQVGSLTPSSKYLARAMTRHIRIANRQVQLNILEVGAGTGVFTKYVIQQMPGGSRFDVVEIDPKFCEILTKNIAAEFGQVPNVNFLCCDITQFKSPERYDFIISGLPFHSFDPALVEKILEIYANLIKPGGTVTFFEYIAIQTLKKPFLTDEEQDTLEKIRNLIKVFRLLGTTTSESIVWRNFLPARVISVTF